MVTGAPGGVRESQGGDGAAAFVVGPDEEAVARFVGRASSTTELLDVYRLPTEPFAHQWEERFGIEVLTPVAIETAKRALHEARVEPGQLTAVSVDATNPRISAAATAALRFQLAQLADQLGDRAGRAGAAHPGLVLARILDHGNPGDRVLVVSVGDGCDAMVLELTERIAQHRAPHGVDRWIGAKRNDLPYNAWLKWRGILPFEPPRRPDPERPAAPPMRRTESWKLSFKGSRCEVCGAGYLPPQRVCVSCGAIDKMREESFADRRCRVATYTIDHLAYSLQPPVVLGVMDFEGGGRFTTELTDLDPSDVKIGNELEMTFRRLYSVAGVHNYFWKARPKR
jgi:hydroxymethylglutaryl-CoA synthase